MDNNNKGEAQQQAASNGSVNNNETAFSKAVARYTSNLVSIAGLLFVLERIVLEIVKIAHDAGLTK